ncbi:uncharacterized protein J3R85_002820 [Psidium guajava]|nr:uncharacterized protein J3R85_002820 [Psidium guajava]
MTVPANPRRASMLWTRMPTSGSVGQVLSRAKRASYILHESNVQSSQSLMHFPRDT